jgi:hypothetical protein
MPDRRAKTFGLGVAAVLLFFPAPLQPEPDAMSVSKAKESAKA